ncbi:MAG: 2-oxoacid:acceptor oxidoreductase family protein [Patescibacteria group bacterium]
MKQQKEIFEIILFGRGGQGAKVASEIITQAAVKEGKFVQSFPNFGPERSGAPTKTFVRISNKPIRNHEPVVDPDAVLVLDETLIGDQDVSKNLDKYGSLIINSAKHREELAGFFPKFEGKIYPIDATGLSLKIIGQPRPNTAILGHFIKITEVVKLESLTEEFRKIFEKKIGKEETDKNILAIEKAYDAI